VSAADTYPPRSDPDETVLTFIAAHSLVLASHVQSLLNVGHHAAHERLCALEERRLLRRYRVSRGHSGYYQITEIGLAVINSDLPPPRLHLDRCRHDLSVPWICLAAVRGAFGRIDRVLTTREQRSRDLAVADSPRPGQPDEPPLGLRVLGTGAGHPTALHYPDLMFIRKEGRVPVELTLNSNGQRQLQTRMTSYGADSNIAAVLYFVETPAVRDTIRRTATELGVEDLIYIRTVVTPKDVLAAAGQ
jgi:hypothetical protein